MSAAPPWSKLTAAQKRWVRANVSNGCGPQKGIARDACKRIRAVHHLTDSQIANSGELVAQAGLRRLLGIRVTVGRNLDLLAALCEAGEESCHRHDWDYWRGGSRKAADRRMRKAWCRAVRDSPAISDDDQARAVVFVGLGWLAIRLGGADDFHDGTRTVADMIAAGCPPR